MVWLRVFTAALTLGRAPSAEALEPSLPERLALVVGTNQTDDPRLPTLRYADDDAIQTAELLTDLGVRVELLVRPDDETARLHPRLQTSPASREALQAAAVRLAAQVREVRAAGRRARLYVIYSGHGDVENNEPYVHLEGGARLWRSELLALIRRVGASTSDVVLDACQANAFVTGRGAAPRATRAPIEGSLPEEREPWPREVGLLTATSASGDSHEWEGFQAGVFSHELRSALRGAADVDLDGTVSYAELASFVSTANSRVLNERFRPRLHGAPPHGAPPDEAPFLVLRPPNLASELHLEDLAEHVYVEDALGTRLLDVHPGPGQSLVLLLPRRRPLFVRSASGARELELKHQVAGAPITAAELRPSRVLRRGAAHVAFRDLFALPFTEREVSASVLAREPLRAESLPTLTVGEDLLPAPADAGSLRPALGYLALGLGLSGGALLGGGAMLRSLDATSLSGEARERRNGQLRALNTAGLAALGAGASALSAFFVWPLFDVRPAPESLRAIPTPLRGGGYGLHVRGGW